jgi:hypothetical protein
VSENNQFKGTVVKVKVMEGSKSERTTHVLKNSNPFYDDYFEKFEGKEVVMEGLKK